MELNSERKELKIKLAAVQRQLQQKRDEKNAPLSATDITQLNDQ
jgi:hypothetical protein